MQARALEWQTTKSKHIIKILCQVQMMIEEHDAPTKVLVPDGATHFGSEMQRMRSCLVPCCNDPFGILERSTKILIGGKILGSVFPRALMEWPFSYTQKEARIYPYIGIGETLRRIIARAVLSTFKDDIRMAAGPMQLCAGQESGCETAVHVMQKLFNSPEVEAVLLVDATNAYKSTNSTPQHTAYMSSDLNHFD